jgi:hypothetical protein
MPFGNEGIHMTSYGWNIRQDEYKKDVNMGTQDVTEEMRDLMAVYENAYQTSSEKTGVILEQLVHYMRAFVAEYDTRAAVEDKLLTLRSKLGLNDCEECEEE